MWSGWRARRRGWGRGERAVSASALARLAELKIETWILPKAALAVGDYGAVEQLAREAAAPTR